MYRHPEGAGFYRVHESVRVDPGGPSRTRQEFADECDINNIMAKYETTGVISHFNDGVPQYVDFTEMPGDLQGALEQLKVAEEAFMRLPAKVRREFDDSAPAFVQFAADPGNIDQMRKWGLAAPAPEVVAEPPAEASE